MQHRDKRQEIAEIVFSCSMYIHSNLKLTAPLLEVTSVGDVAIQFPLYKLDDYHIKGSAFTTKPTGAMAPMLSDFQ